MAVSPNAACTMLTALMNNLQGRRSPGTPSECRDANQTGYGPQLEPANVTPNTGAPRFVTCGTRGV